MSKTGILWRKSEVKLDLSNYAPKTDFENAIGVYKSKLVKIIDLASLKSEVDK